MGREEVDVETRKNGKREKESATKHCNKLHDDGDDAADDDDKVTSDPAKPCFTSHPLASEKTMIKETMWVVLIMKPVEMGNVG